MMNTTNTFPLNFALLVALTTGCNGDDTSDSATDGVSGSGSTSTTTSGTTTEDSTTTDDSTTTSGSESASGSGSTSTTTSGTTTEDSTTTDDSTTTSGGSTSTTTGTTGDGGVCGDGNLDEGEECDLGDQNGKPHCKDCQLGGLCGDGFVDDGEECDDGNTENGDDCTLACTLAVCGDGVVKTEGEDPEECDDGNDKEGDGCANDCKVPSASCGDGILDEEEQCDDGNNEDGDGCTTDCNLEGYNCHQISKSPCDTPDKDDPLAPFKAMGLGCPTGIQIADAWINSPDKNAWQMPYHFGGEQSPATAQEGSAFLLVTNGQLKPPSFGGIIEYWGDEVFDFLTGHNGNPSVASLYGQKPLGGGVYHDVIRVSFTIIIPQEAEFLEFDWMAILGEWPGFPGSIFDDPIFLSVTINGQEWPFFDGFNQVNAERLHPEMTDLPYKGISCKNPEATNGSGFSCDEIELGGTGMEGRAMTGWKTAKFPVESGGIATITIAVADAGDDQLLTGMGFDNFNFDCKPMPL